MELVQTVCAVQLIVAQYIAAFHFLISMILFYNVNTARGTVICLLTRSLDHQYNGGHHVFIPFYNCHYFRDTFRLGVISIFYLALCLALLCIQGCLGNVWKQWDQPSLLDEESRGPWRWSDLPKILHWASGSTRNRSLFFVCAFLTLRFFPCPSPPHNKCFRCGAVLGM